MPVHDQSQVIQDPETSFASPVTLKDLFQEELQRLDNIIERNLESPVTMIPKIGSHLFKAGGKRLRPLLMMGGFYGAMYGKKTPLPVHDLFDRTCHVAAGIEFIHGATLLHDDVIDNSDTRRHQASANALWGNKLSILVGDFLFARAFGLVSRYGNGLVHDMISSASRRMVEGEVLQMGAVGDIEMTAETYREIVITKTAALFEVACGTGAIMGGARPEEAQPYRVFGHHLGICFQMIDDIMDYKASAQALGKEPGDDFRESKVTLPVMMALQGAGAEEKEFWDRTMARHRQNPEDFEQACQYLKRHGAFEKAFSYAQKEADKAQKALACLDPSPYKSAFLKTLDLCLKKGA